MKGQRLLIVVVLTLGSAIALAEKKPKLNIHVTDVKSDTGFAVRDKDSVKDLKTAINKGTWGRGTKWMTVDDEAPAVFVVEIVGRNRQDRELFIHYRVLFHGQEVDSGDGYCNNSTWYCAANDLRKKLEVFVEDNYARLTEAEDGR